MYIFQSTNPCLCTPGNPVNPEPECPDDCNCLKVCSISINANDSSAVGPCAKTGTRNIMAEEFGHDFCACGANDPRWTVEHYDSTFFVTVSITRAGVLTWITKGAEILEKGYGEVILKVCCGTLSYYITVLVGVKDVCNCPECNDCEICDPCTGLCVEPEIELTFKTVSNSGNTSLHASN